jgi:acetylcholinesterase
VYKRGKATRYLGAYHGSDIPEFFGSGVAPDFIGTDALGIFSNLVIVTMLIHVYPVNFANTGNPTIPRHPKCLLSAVNWQPWNSSPDLLI